MGSTINTYMNFGPTLRRLMTTPLKFFEKGVWFEPRFSFTSTEIIDRGTIIRRTTYKSNYFTTTGRLMSFY